MRLREEIESVRWRDAIGAATELAGKPLQGIRGGFDVRGVVEGVE